MNAAHWNNIIQAIEVVVLILGAWLTYRGWQKDREKDRESTRSNIRIKYLSEAYEGIALATERGGDRIEYNEFLRDLERAAAIIQLYGQEDEIKIIRTKIKEYNQNLRRFNHEYTQFMKEKEIYDKNSGMCLPPRPPVPFEVDINDLVDLLRNRLRAELSLPSLDKDVMALRMIRSSPNKGD